MRKVILSGIFILLLVLLGCSDKASDTISLLKKNYNDDPTLDSAIVLAEYYNTNYHRSVDEVEEGIAWLEEVNKEYADSSKLQILLGNLYTLAGECYFEKDDYTSALKYVDKGIQVMDRTLVKNPDDPYVLIFHGINNATLPDMFNRKENAIKDFNKLIALGEDITGEYDRIRSYTHLIDIYTELQDVDKVKELKKMLQTEYPDYKRGN